MTFDISKKKPVTEQQILENATKLGFGEHAVKVLMRRTLWRNTKGETVELPEDMFRRTATVMAEIDKEFGTSKAEIKQLADQFYDILVSQDFLSYRAMINAGRPYPWQQLAACYVFPVKDDLNDIFSIMQRAAFIQKWDAAVGIDYSVLRQRGAVIGTTGGKSSGPVSFMTLFDKVSEVISEGSLRRGANMGVLRIDHPDIEEFIHAKETPGVLEYFNVSVGITDDFMKAVKNNEEYDLIDPRTKEPVKRLPARQIWDQIVEGAWRSAEPGLIFLDEIERKNPTPHVGKMTAVNLCGEQPLLPWESCILGNIKLSNFVIDNDGTKEIDWDRLAAVVRLGVRFLDNAVEGNHYFYPEIEAVVKNGNRKIGLGVMAFADMLLVLGIPYNSDEGVAMGGKIMGFIQKHAEEASSELAKVRGNFKNFKGSRWQKEKGFTHMRNACVTTVAPTGTLGVIANCSSGLEPVFAFAYTRYGLGSDVKNKDKMFTVNEYLTKTLKDQWLYSQELMEKIVETGSIQNLVEIPAEIKKVFVNAMDISPEWHVKMQAAFQEHVDSAITKTINLPNSATPADVEKTYWMAYESKCKGVTVYRDSSRHEQVLTVGTKSNYNAEHSQKK